MNRVRSRSETHSKPWLAMAAVLAVVVLVAVWLWPRSSVELSDRGYDVTLALYRVCNQRSEEGLAKIEEQLALMASGVDDSTSHRAIAEIIAQAKSGQWRQASVACRKALDDQVR